jgi:cyclohexanone monooxygenase
VTLVRSDPGLIERPPRPLTGPGRLRRDLGLLYAANGLIGFIFSATDPVAVVLAVGAVFDEDTNLWTVTTSDGTSVTSRNLVNALGLLAKSNIPDIPGRDTFAGPLVHTNAWPEDLDITGKRVGVIGTGSTGTQFIVAAAKMAGHLTVFQRSPQYCVPSGNGPVDQAEVHRTKEDFDAIWDQVRNSVVAFGFQESGVEAMSGSEDERHRVFDPR